MRSEGDEAGGVLGWRSADSLQNCKRYYLGGMKTALSVSVREDGQVKTDDASQGHFPDASLPLRHSDPLAAARIPGIAHLAALTWSLVPGAGKRGMCVFKWQTCQFRQNKRGIHWAFKSAHCLNLQSSKKKCREKGCKLLDKSMLGLGCLLLET